MTQARSRLQLLEEFEAASPETLFKQETYCAVLACSPGKAERDRWAGNGVPFIKLGGAVRYRKSDILEYLNSQHTRFSTTSNAEKR
jgi:hypothetical protein